jgi:hypothetical protein
MNEPFDLFVFIVLVAVYFVFRISLTLPRRTSVKREAAKRPLSHQKQSSPRTRGTQRSGRQNDHFLADDHVSLAHVAPQTNPRSACIAGLQRRSMPRHSGWPQLCNNAGNGRPVRCALAARNAWVLQNAQ